MANPVVTTFRCPACGRTEQGDAAWKQYCVCKGIVYAHRQLTEMVPDIKPPFHVNHD